MRNNSFLGRAEIFFVVTHVINIIFYSLHFPTKCLKQHWWAVLSRSYSQIVGASGETLAVKPGHDSYCSLVFKVHLSVFSWEYLHTWLSPQLWSFSSLLFFLAMTFSTFCFSAAWTVVAMSSTWVICVASLLSSWPRGHVAAIAYIGAE